MPALANERHELFAQELAKGVSGSEAYRAAGYDVLPEVAKSNAYRLGKKAHLVSRIAELQEERIKIDAAATQIAAEALSIDRQWVMSRLKKNAEAALQAANGPDGFCAPAGSVANRALELLGKEIGMFSTPAPNNTIVNNIFAGSRIDFGNMSEESIAELRQAALDAVQKDDPKLLDGTPYKVIK